MSKLPSNLVEKASIKTAGDLEVDDWFRLGNETYRVTKLEDNEYDQLVIHFTSSASKTTDVLADSPGESKHLVVPHTLPFKGFAERRTSSSRPSKSLPRLQVPSTVEIVTAPVKPNVFGRRR